jgi:divinyl chlorophyllide a 8-vinyl-reductase
MLLWDQDASHYDADATPSFGSDTPRAFHAELITGSATIEVGEHAVF